MSRFKSWNMQAYMVQFIKNHIFIILLLFLFTTEPSEHKQTSERHRYSSTTSQHKLKFSPSHTICNLYGIIQFVNLTHINQHQTNPNRSSQAPTQKYQRIRRPNISQAEESNPALMFGGWKKVFLLKDTPRCMEELILPQRWAGV